MKAITLQQPYATLVAIGAKQYETRGWKTNYRGPIAIHAGKNRVGLECIALYMSRIGVIDKNLLKVWEWHVVDALQNHSGLTFHEFHWPLGSVIAIADLTACIPVALIGDGLGRREMAFGDYSAGRFAWKLENIKPVDPVAAIGKQGLWNWEK